MRNAFRILAAMVLVTSGLALAAPPPPPDVTPGLIGFTPGEFTVSWTAPVTTYADGGTVSLSYSLERRHGTGSPFQHVAEVTGQTQYVDPITASGTYAYRLVSKDNVTTAVETGPESKEVFADFDAPGAPPNLTVLRNLETGALDVAWYSAQDVGSGVASYYLTVEQGGGATGHSLGNVLSARYPESNAAAGGQYTVKVKAQDAAGNFSPYSEVLHEVPTQLVLHAPTLTVTRDTPLLLQIESKSAAGQKVPFDANLKLVALSNGVPVEGAISVDSQPTQTVRMTPAQGGELFAQVTFHQLGTFELQVADEVVPEISGRLGNFTVVEALPPRIFSQPNPVAAVGLPYVFNHERTVSVEGSGPLRFSRCAGPESFRVDPLSGAVRWIPEAAGLTPLCIRVENEVGADELPFEVNVEARPPTDVFVSFSATPERGPAALEVRFEAANLLEGQLYTFDYGDGTPPYTTSEAAALHTYRVPGGYLATLTVTDLWGNQASSRTPIEVLDAQGRRPPRAKIAVKTSTGEEALKVDFSCHCEAGDAAIVAYRWELDAQTVLATEAPSHEFGPGRYLVRLTVADANGLSAQAEQEIVVTKSGRLPPECNVSVSPFAGPVPLSVLWTGATASHSGEVGTRTWQFSDGSSSAGLQVNHTYEAPRWMEGVFTASDETGLSCVARRSAVALTSDGLIPPRLLLPLAPEAAQCVKPYAGYGAGGLGATGSTSLAWSITKGPPGLAIDPASGAISWSPGISDRGEQEVLVKVTNAAGSAEQSLALDVACAETLEFDTPFGCSGAGGMPLPPMGLLLGAVGTLFALARRRRR